MYTLWIIHEDIQNILNLKQTWLIHVLSKTSFVNFGNIFALSRMNITFPTIVSSLFPVNTCYH